MKVTYKSITKKQREQSILTICIGFLVIYAISQNPIFLVVTICIGLTGLISPKLGNGLVFLWFQFGWVLSLIMPKILLSIIFLIVLTPIAWMSRLFNADKLMLKNKVNSTFKASVIHFNKNNFLNPW